MQNSVNLKATFNVAFPLMLTSLSSMLMITIDRIMLAHYDIMVMNAVAVVGLLLFTFEHGFASIAGISEVFAGNFNGAMQYDKTASSTWQMIFFGLASALISIPSGLFLGPYVIPPIFLESSLCFFQILMSLLFISVLKAAVAGFFIGTKQAKIIAIAAFSSNALNIFLNFLLIFGIDGWFSPMGAKGAAIGTSISLLVEFLIVFIVFLSKKQHKKYHTRNCAFDMKVMVSTLKIGIPNSIGWIMNIFSGYVIMLIIVDTSTHLVTAQNICINILIFIYATNEGIQKAVIAMVSNVLGAGEYKKIKKVISAALKIQILCFAILFIAIFLFMEEIINLYTDDTMLHELLHYGFLGMLIFYVIDGIVWILGCVLIAGGDTKFTTMIDIIMVWSLRVLPLYFLHKVMDLNLPIIWSMYIISSSGMIFVFLYRIFYSKWNHSIFG